MAPPTPRFSRASVALQSLQGSNDLLYHKTHNMARGKLIVFEGLDRAGKSTQCQMLVDDLQNDGIKVRHMRFPGTCAWIEAIRWRVDAR